MQLTQPALIVLLVGLAWAPWAQCARMQASHAVKPYQRRDPEPDSAVWRGLHGNLPVVMWHGMGDSCCEGLGDVAKLLEQELGIFVFSIAGGDTVYADVWSGFYGNVNLQVAKACADLRELDELRGGFHMIGFSQGAQFLRAVMQRCGHQLPPVHTLISMGGQHQGVMNTPGCTADMGGVAAKACTVMQQLLSRGAYAPWIRSNVVQAQYFKDPYHLPAYMHHNIFLPDINNELAQVKQLYAINLASLQQLVLFRFDNDTTVVPRDSAWFSFYNGTGLVELWDQDIYTKDTLGLARLHSRGALHFDSVPGEHMRFSLEWFRTNVVHKYLKLPTSAAKGAAAVELSAVAQ